MAIEIPKLPEHLPTSAIRFIGKHVNRIEDPALVSGTVDFIDNWSMPNMLHCAILRTPHPHARILSIDTSAALALKGVAAVLTGEDVKRWCNPVNTSPAGWGAYCLGVDKVRFVGEPVAAVAAESRYLAEDALELIRVEYELLPPVANAMEAIKPEAARVFEEKDSNIIQSRVYTWGNVDEVFAAADHIVSNTFRWNRVGANPSETFGCICQWDLSDNSLNCYGPFQTPRTMGLRQAHTLNLPSNKVRIVPTPMGSNFGGKGGARGTDIASLLSRKCDGRPVKYIEDRLEYLIGGASQSWDRYYEGSLAVKDDGTVTGFKVKLLDDQGAGTEGWGTVSVAKPLSCFTGHYRIEAAQYDTQMVATNRLPAAAYRGYGPPPHFFVLESLMDMTARKLGMDPAELRRRNFIQPEQFPYTIPSGNEYDSGSYEEVLNKLLSMGEYQNLREEQARARAEGRLVGISVVNTIEPGVFDWTAYHTVGVTFIGVPDGVKVSFDLLGNVTVLIGFAMQGHGQYTVLAQVVADYWGLELNAVAVTTAASDATPPHFGPAGSRAGVAFTGAALGACMKIEENFRQLLAHVWQVQPDQVELLDGRFRLKHDHAQSMSVAEVAGLMLSRSDMLPPGMEPCADATFIWTASRRNVPDEQGRARSYLTAANAAHLVMVEIDRDTGRTKILKYFLVDDCGTRLNPCTVEGQQQGALAQGVGAALYEEYVYNDQAQPLVTTLVDYLMPSIHETPIATKDSVITISPVAPLGAKGCGEGAIHGTPVAIICAINDALAPLGLEIRETPASPRRIWQLLQQAQGR